MLVCKGRGWAHVQGSNMLHAYFMKLRCWTQHTTNTPALTLCERLQNPPPALLSVFKHSPVKTLTIPLSFSPCQLTHNYCASPWESSRVYLYAEPQRTRACCKLLPIRGGAGPLMPRSRLPWPSHSKSIYLTVWTHRLTTSLPTCGGWVCVVSKAESLQPRSYPAGVCTGAGLNRHSVSAPGKSTLWHLDILWEWDGGVEMANSAL